MDLAQLMPFAGVLGMELADSAGAAGRLVARTTQTQAVLPGA